MDPGGRVDRVLRSGIDLLQTMNYPAAATNTTSPSSVPLDGERPPTEETVDELLGHNNSMEYSDDEQQPPGAHLLSDEEDDASTASIMSPPPPPPLPTGSHTPSTVPQPIFSAGSSSATPTFARTPQMVPPVRPQTYGGRPPAVPTVNNPLPAEADVIPSDIYSKVHSSILLKKRPAAIGGTGPDLDIPHSECGSFFNKGDNRVVRSVFQVNNVDLSITSLSFNPASWICASCPKKHGILTTGTVSENGNGGEGGKRRLVIVLADQNFPAVLPTASGKCLVIIRSESGSLDELGDLLIKLIPKNWFLPKGTVVLAGSLSQLSIDLSSYAMAAVKLVRRFNSFFRGNVTTVPFVPPPMGGCGNPSTIRLVRDGCDWLGSIPGYQLPATMATVRSIVMKEGGGSARGVHYAVSYLLPLTFEDYKGNFFRSLGRQDLPVSVPILSFASEKTFIVALLCELNENLLTGLDPEPNISRSAKRPEMYCALRAGGIEAALFIGGSNARRLSAAASTLGVDSIRLASGGWKLSKDSVDILLPDLSEVLESLPAGAPIVCFCVDNSTFFGLREDGGMAPLSRCVEGDDGFHCVGDLVVGPERSFGTVVEQLNRIVEKAQGHPVFIISPVPRYISMPCCDDGRHISNRTDEDFFKTILCDLHKVRRLLAAKIPNATVLDGLELICGTGYDLLKAENQARAGWSADPVHPNAHVYAKMALNLIEKITPAEERLDFPGPGPGQTGRKRKTSGSDTSVGSLNRSQRWSRERGSGGNSGGGRSQPHWSYDGHSPRGANSGRASFGRGGYGSRPGFRRN